jgi:hypothetical protein
MVCTRRFSVRLPVATTSRAVRLESGGSRISLGPPLLHESLEENAAREHDQHDNDQRNIDKIPSATHREREAESSVRETEEDESGAKEPLVDFDGCAVHPGALVAHVEAVMQKAADPLADEEEDDNDADYLVSRIEVFALLCMLAR